jgi:hypothetical protein
MLSVPHLLRSYPGEMVQIVFILHIALPCCVEMLHMAAPRGLHQPLFADQS